MKPIPYGKQEINKEDIDAVVDVLKSDFLTQGPKVEEFESKFAAYIGSKYAIAVSNGTAALHLSALAMGVKRGTKIITSPLSFVATSNCIEYCGGEVVFCDINPETLCLDINLVREKLESAPKETYSGIIPADFAGYPVNMEEFGDLAKEYNLWILEDSCHAPGGYFIDSKKQIQKCGNGNYADLAIFSFHPVKHIACGEGGMITTNDFDLCEKIKLLRTHGITKEKDKLAEFHGGWSYEMQNLGFNYRLSDIQCALGLSQLRRAENNLKKRRSIANYYKKKLKSLPIEFPEANYDPGTAFHLFIIYTEDRLNLYNFLKEKNIYTQVHYIPIHTMPYYVKKYGSQKYKFTESHYDKCLSIPIYQGLDRQTQDYVIESIKSFYDKL